MGLVAEFRGAFGRLGSWRSPGGDQFSNCRHVTGRHCGKERIFGRGVAARFRPGNFLWHAGILEMGLRLKRLIEAKIDCPLFAPA
jgi:hypothetical protein